jgi:peptidoglycan hydrolase FlgJ
VTPTEFVRLLRPHAERVNQRTGIPVEVMLAQAALETGWLAKPTRDKTTGRDSLNLFNIKGTGPAGSVTALTTEYVRGQKVKVDAQFRAYGSYEQSFADYARLITTNKRYAPAMAVRGNPVAFAQALQQCGYATDPQYAAKLVSIMRRYMGVK